MLLKLAPLLVALPASALPAETVHDINPTARSTTFAPKPNPPVPDVVDDPAWLIATSGFCSNLNVVMKERDVEASETEGDTAAHFMADIEFNYYPQAAVKFTDFPHHLAKTIEGDAAEADALVSSAWDHKNIALLEPTSTCSSDQQADQAWGISVFKVEEHRHCMDGETAWEGHPCVHYSGYVSAATSNFVNVNEGRFVCQLFVDSIVDEAIEAGVYVALAALIEPHKTCDLWNLGPCVTDGKNKMKDVIRKLQHEVRQLPTCDKRGEGLVKSVMDLVCSVDSVLDQWKNAVCDVCHSYCDREAREGGKSARCGTAGNAFERELLDCHIGC